ncbi:MAG: hypothetical protein HRT90_09470 [Candidatus Margulisbacteria bacterium]|nr:hypothetical protein [Candidatus Margulisiibacteriota bacterium]
MSKRITFTTTIDGSLIKKIKMLGILEDKNMNDYIEEALKKVLKEKESQGLKIPNPPS